MKPNLGDVLADKYRLDRVLGEGGMSMVFGATNQLTGKQVAIKWLQPDMIRDEEQSHRLLREAQATSSIDHPNVVNVFDVGRHEGALFLVMELLHGEPLSHLLARGPQDPIEFVRLMMPVLRGVHAAHRMGVVHRDLKPDNIFVCRDPHGEAREPKVLDFGISKLLDVSELGTQSELTREGTIFGTPQYMAPEQMRDARVADARSDLYALGVIFYRALTNEYPYDADTLTALAIRIVEGNATVLHERCENVDEGLSDVVMRALALHPEQRFQTIAAFAQALEPYADGMSFAQPISERESGARLARRDSAPSGRQRILSVPSTLRESTYGPRRATSGEAVTTALDPSELEVVEAVRRPSIVVPPPPPPRRASKHLTRKQSFWLGAALFGASTIVPLGVQVVQNLRTAAERSTPAPAVAARAEQPPSTRAIAETPRDSERKHLDAIAENDLQPTVVPLGIAEPPDAALAMDEAAPLASNASTMREPAQEGGLALQDAMVPRIALDRPRRRPAPLRAPPTRVLIDEPPALSHVLPALEDATPVASERNPYLMR